MSKAALKVRCSKILSSGPCIVEGEDFVFLMTDVFPRHPEWDQKRGDGVSHIEVRRHGQYKNFGFFLIRTDGTSVDISYRVALDGAGTVYSRFCSAARSEINSQVWEWKQRNCAPEFGMQCDHHPLSFDALLKMWLKTIRLGHEEVPVNSQLVGHTALFAERGLAMSWQRFHREHARYQWLTREENVRKSNKVVADTQLEGFVF